jgi:electron transfer flavoprotein beta subunit
MRIIVLIKPGAELQDSDACAVEHALRLARRRMDVQVTLVAIGSAECVRALRYALALGADDAVHALDKRISPYDALTLSRVYAEMAAELGADLVVCGTGSITPNLSLIPDMVAARLETPVVSVPARPGSPPRYPSFPAIAEARQKLISTRILPASESVISVREIPPCPNTIINADDDPRAAARQLADFLAERRLI